MVSLLKPSFRLAAAAFMVSGYVRVGNLIVDAFIQSQYGGHSQYLTMQGLAIAVATMLIGVVVDLVPSFNALRTLRRYLFVTAMPLAVVISSIYWTLLIFFPHLIIAQGPMTPGEPSSSSEAPKPFYLPLSIDLALHACPAVALLIDFFAFETKYTKREVDVGVPVIVALYAVGYGLWVEFCATKNKGIFPYPFLTQSPLGGRIAIYAGAAILAAVSFRALNALHPHSR